MKMNFAVMLDVFNTIINECIRNIPDYWKAIICLVSFALGCLCLAKSIVTKDKKLIPFKTGMFLLSLLFFAVMLVYVLVK